MRVVIDTCVWVAGIRSRRGAGFALLSEIVHGRYRYGVSVPLFVEYQARLLDAVAAGHSRLTGPQVDAVLAALAYHATEVSIYFRLRPNLKDESDNMVFECAANFAARAIVTHSVRDFARPELQGYGIEVWTPGELLRRIRRSE